MESEYHVKRWLSTHNVGLFLLTLPQLLHSTNLSSSGSKSPSLHRHRCVDSDGLLAFSARFQGSSLYGPQEPWGNRGRRLLRVHPRLIVAGVYQLVLVRIEIAIIASIPMGLPVVAISARFQGSFPLHLPWEPWRNRPPSAPCPFVIDLRRYVLPSLPFVMCFHVLHTFLTILCFWILRTQALPGGRAPGSNVPPCFAISARDGTHAEQNGTVLYNE
jgi:hypothetical protein